LQFSLQAASPETFGYRVLRRIFGPKREEVVGGWRRLRNEELHNLVRFIKYYLGDQVKEDEMGVTCSTHEVEEKCVQNFGRKT
jgi:hypothetical protein